MPSYIAAMTAAAAAATASVLVARMDCNASLYMYSALRAPSRPISKQKIWIIGASSGIGRELALRLSQNENHLILSARSQGKLEEVAKECQEATSSANIKIHVLDVTDTRALLEASREIDCDICVLNAGRGHLSLASETTLETITDMLHGNALWQMVLAPTLRCRHLIVVSSIAAILPVPLSAAYAASKHALQGYFKSLAVERSDLIIDLVCPGPVDTEFHSNSKKQDASVTTRSAQAPSPLKMSAARCAQLTLAAASRSHHSNHGSTVWLCPQPTLTALYLEKLLPAQLFESIMRRVAAKRIDMYKRGVDLYDPKSWKN